MNLNGALVRITDPVIAGMMPFYMLYEHPGPRLTRAIMEKEQERCFFVAKETLAEYGSIPPVLHLFVEKQGRLALVVCPAAGFMQNEQTKHFLTGFVRSGVFGEVYGALIASETWIARDAAAKELLRRRAAGEAIQPKDLEQRDDGVIVSLETCVGVRCLSARCLRDSAGKIMSFEDIDMHPSNGELRSGSLFGFVERSVS